jgi:dipeptidase D
VKGKLLADLQPTLVWGFFEQLSRIPRCTKKEQRVRRWIKDWADQGSVPCKEDGAGNLLLRRAASPGRETHPTLVLQAHLDMVCLKDERSTVDFDNDPIPIRVEGSRVRAQGTTLGADNGVGVACSLAALIDPALTCGPLEALLTADEEEGASGALGLKPGFFTGRYLLNLDSEEAGVITIGTAGYELTEYSLALSPEEHAGLPALSLSIRGLAGGHSGIDIHLERRNAIKLAAEGLRRLAEQMPVRLGRLEGGEAANSIPVMAELTAGFPAGWRQRAFAVIEGWRRETLRRARSAEPELEITVTPDTLTAAWTVEQTATIVRLLEEIPHGPLRYSRDIEGLVESSSNLATVKGGREAVHISVSCRSSVESALDELGRRLRRIGESSGAAVRQHSRLPAWTANPSSPLTRLVRREYGRVLAAPASLKAYHAGLECGVFTGLSPELQMASIGPDIRMAHTPEEYVKIPSVGLLWEVVRGVAASMGELA